MRFLFSKASEIITLAFVSLHSEFSRPRFFPSSVTFFHFLSFRNDKYVFVRNVCAGFRNGRLWAPLSAAPVASSSAVAAAARGAIIPLGRALLSLLPSRFLKFRIAFPTGLIAREKSRFFGIWKLGIKADFLHEYIPYFIHMYMCIYTDWLILISHFFTFLPQLLVISSWKSCFVLSLSSLRLFHTSPFFALDPREMYYESNIFYYLLLRSFPDSAGLVSHL